MEFITVGKNIGSDDRVFFIIDYFLKELYPELINFSSEYKYKTLPNPNLKPQEYQKQILQIKNALRKQPILLNEIGTRLEKTTIKTLMSRNNNENLRYHEIINFDHLEDIYQEFIYGLPLTSSKGVINTFLGFFEWIFSDEPQLLAVGVRQMAFIISCNLLDRELSSYEMAVLWHYMDSFDPITIMSIRTESIKKAKGYFNISPYIIDGKTPNYDYLDGMNNLSSVNNHLDAFRHVYAAARLTLSFGKDFARDFLDAHEYKLLRSTLASGTEQSVDFGIDMDLLNNHTGIRLANKWNHIKNDFMLKRLDYPEIPEREENALAYFVLHHVAYGHLDYKVYTFSNDIAFANKNPQEFFNGNNVITSPFLRLSYTNFGEEENWEMHCKTGESYSKRPYFLYRSLLPEDEEYTMY